MSPTPTPTHLSVMLRALPMLKPEDLQALIKACQEKLRRSYSYGDVVEFNDRAGFQIRMRVEKVNTKTLGGTQVGGTGGRVGMKWRVAPTYCKPYTPEPGRGAF